LPLKDVAEDDRTIGIGPVPGMGRIAAARDAGIVADAAGAVLARGRVDIPCQSEAAWAPSRGTEIEWQDRFAHRSVLREIGLADGPPVQWVVVRQVRREEDGPGRIPFRETGGRQEGAAVDALGKRLLERRRRFGSAVKGVHRLADA